MKENDIKFCSFPVIFGKITVKQIFFVSRQFLKIFPYQKFSLYTFIKLYSKETVMGLLVIIRFFIENLRYQKKNANYHEYQQ